VSEVNFSLTSASDAVDRLKSSLHGMKRRRGHHCCRGFVKKWFGGVLSKKTRLASGETAAKVLES
jgi:hypothetical protein